MKPRVRTIGRCLAVIATLVAIQPPALAQPDAAANGCGSGWNTYLVPDALPVLGCQFESACNGHDQCYGKCIPGAPGSKAPECEYLRCRKGGDLEGRPECGTPAFSELRLAATERRQTCDRNFYTALLNTNRDRRRCAAFAALYRGAVQLFGDGSFFGVGPEATDRAPEIRMPADAQEAIIELLSEGTPNQLEAVVHKLEAPEPELDLTQPLKFDRWRGLRN